MCAPTRHECARSTGGAADAAQPAQEAGAAVPRSRGRPAKRAPPCDECKRLKRACGLPLCPQQTQAPLAPPETSPGAAAEQPERVPAAARLPERRSERTTCGQRGVRDLPGDVRRWARGKRHQRLTRPRVTPSSGRPIWSCSARACAAGPGPCVAAGRSMSCRALPTRSVGPPWSFETIQSATHILVNRAFRSYDRLAAVHSRSREIARDRISADGRSIEIVTHPLLPIRCLSV